MERLQMLHLAVLLSLSAGLAAQENEAEVYRIDIPQSDIHWRVYKAGALARFGHNHVISVETADGEIFAYPDSPRSGFELIIPVADLVIDDPELRERYGEDFSSVPSAADIEGTRGNMLGDQVLNAEQFGELRLSADKLLAESGSGMIDFTLEIVGHTVELTVPAEIAIDTRTIVVRGEFGLALTELDMVPFSALMGALSVADHMDFTYVIHATKVE